MSNIILLIPDGVGVRNYVYSNFTTNLISEGNNVLLYHKLSNSAIQEIKTHKPQITNFKEIPSFIESSTTRLLRESLVYARLQIGKKKLKNNSILEFWTPSKKGLKKKILYGLAEVLGFILSKNYKLVKNLEKYYDNKISSLAITKEIKDFLLNFKPDLVINLHQRAIITPPIIEAAKSLNITTSTVIFSWDNIPKARLISRYDYYFVWSNLMRKELKLLYPEIHNNQIKVSGTPQFEFYFDKRFFDDKINFYKKYGLDILKKTICFSGNDLTSPYEANYLEDLCEEVNKIDRAERPQILFRRCPVDKSKRFDKIINKYKDIVCVINPDWKTEKGNEDSFVSIYPTYNDIYLLVNTIKYSDVVINLGSTMAHDAAVLDKPCLYFNYNPVKNPVFKVEDVFNFQHFRSMNNLDAVGWLNNKEEIIDKLTKALETPENVAKDRKKWLEKIVLHPLEKNSSLLNKIISEEIIKK